MTKTKWAEVDIKVGLQSVEKVLEWKPNQLIRFIIRTVIPMFNDAETPKYKLVMGLTGKISVEQSAHLGMFQTSEEAQAYANDFFIAMGIRDRGAA